jgi:hypothetical protein
VAPLIGCYERFWSEGSLDLHDLDDALASLRVLPPLEERLGRAIALVSSEAREFRPSRRWLPWSSCGPPLGSGPLPKPLCLQLPRTVPPGRLDPISCPCLAWSDR